MKKRFASIVAIVLCFCLAACGGKGTETKKDDIASAKDYLYSMYKDKAVVTASDYDVVSVMKINGNDFSVDWTVDAADGVTVVAGDKMTTIDVNEKTPVEITYVLKATIKNAAGETATLEFPHSVPAYKQTTWADYVAAEKDATLVCSGVVTGIISKTNGNSSNCIYFQDSDGGYYAYNMGDDPVSLGIKPGMSITVTGSKDTYSGTYEIMNGAVEINDTNIKAVAPVDYTDLFKNASSIKDAALVEKQSLLVTIKGVEVGEQDTASGYYYFTLGNNKSYVRISSSVCPIVTEKDAFIAGHSEHAGWVANVTGLICLYDGAFYLTPVTVDAFEYVSLPTKTDAEKVEFEAGNVKFATKYTKATDLELAAVGSTYDDVKFTWATSDETVAPIVDGVVKVSVPAKDTNVTLTATITCGAATQTVEYTFKAEAPAADMCEAEILNKAFALAEGESINGKQVLQGTITEIVTEYSAEYQNITVNMDVAGQTIQAFRLKGEGADALKVGDVIVVTGEIKNYKGTVEFNSGCTFSKTLTVEDAKAAVVMEKAYALEENEAMSGTQVLQGTITEIVTEYSAEYQNITVNMDVQGQVIQAFRLKGEGADALKVGDVIVVTGEIKNYKGTVEFNSGCTFSKTLTVEEAKDAAVMVKAYALEENEAMNGLQELKGTITEIVTEYSAEYQNITVNMDVQGQVIQAFRLKGEGADALKVGDVIVVTGEIKNYKGTVEFNSGCTFVK